MATAQLHVINIAVRWPNINKDKYKMYLLLGKYKEKTCFGSIDYNMCML